MADLESQPVGAGDEELRLPTHLHTYEARGWTGLPDTQDREDAPTKLAIVSRHGQRHPTRERESKATMPQGRSEVVEQTNCRTGATIPRGSIH